jgi:hypothetical protein
MACHVSSSNCTRLPTIDFQLSQSLKVLDGQLDNKRALAAAPSIAFDAAGESFAVAVDLDNVFPAAVAMHLATLLDYPRFSLTPSPPSRESLLLVNSTPCPAFKLLQTGPTP